MHAVRPTPHPGGDRRRLCARYRLRQPPPTGELYPTELKRQHPKRDWILTRILWLCGEEPGYNRLGEVDSMRRYIYIHGSPDEDRMGEPSSHGCVKMRNDNVIRLFDRVPVGTPVVIQEAGLE